ncbi:hypothetical protein [Bacillus manliponensis]
MKKVLVSLLGIATVFTLTFDITGKVDSKNPIGIKLMVSEGDGGG